MVKQLGTRNGKRIGRIGPSRRNAMKARRIKLNKDWQRMVRIKKVPRRRERLLQRRLMRRALELKTKR